MRAFADTSALYAVLDRDDAQHAAAAHRWRTLLDSDVALVTSNYVALETVALCQHRLGVAAVAALVTDLLPVVTLEWVTAEDHRAALAALLTAARRDLSLVDCTSFELMRRLGLRDAFAFDRHFAEQGYTVVP
jgi:predicted nucleic acid-binding protein